VILYPGVYAAGPCGHQQALLSLPSLVRGSQTHSGPGSSPCLCSVVMGPSHLPSPGSAGCLQALWRGSWGTSLACSSALACPGRAAAARPNQPRLAPLLLDVAWPQVGRRPGQKFLSSWENLSGTERFSWLAWEPEEVLGSALGRKGAAARGICSPVTASTFWQFLEWKKNKEFNRKTKSQFFTKQLDDSTRICLLSCFFLFFFYFAIQFTFVSWFLALPISVTSVFSQKKVKIPELTAVTSQEAYYACITFAFHQPCLSHLPSFSSGCCWVQCGWPRSITLPTWVNRSYATFFQIMLIFKIFSLWSLIG